MLELRFTVGLCCLLSISIAQSLAVIRPFGIDSGLIRFRYSDGAQVEVKSAKFSQDILPLKKDSPRIAHTKRRWHHGARLHPKLSQSFHNLYRKPQPLTSRLAKNYDRLLFNCKNVTIAVIDNQKFGKCFDSQSGDFYYVRSIYDRKQPENRHRRRKRQFFPGSGRLGNSDFPIEISALDSNISITQMINVTSGRSLIDIKETFVQLRIDSNFSHARINAKQSRVNITVLTPTISLNTSQSLSLNMWSDQSELFVRTNKSEKSAFVSIDSGKSGLSVDSVQSAVEAYTEVLSNVSVTQWSAPGLEESISVNSALDTTSKSRNLVIVAVNDKANITARLLKALSFLTFADINIEIRTEDNEVVIYTGTYVVTIKTILSAYSITMTKDLMTFISDNITLLINPHTANITAFVPQSFMQILPENSTLELKSDSAAGKDYADAHVSIESLKSTWEILPKLEKIYGKIQGTRAVVNANNTDVGIKAEISNMEISSGRPVILIEAGNTSIDIRHGDGGIFERDANKLTTRSTLPPFLSNWSSVTGQNGNDGSGTKLPISAEPCCNGSTSTTQSADITTVPSRKPTYITRAPVPVSQCCANDTTTTDTATTSVTATASPSNLNLTTHTPIPVSECCASEPTKASSTPQSSSSTQTSTTSSPSIATVPSTDLIRTTETSATSATATVSPSNLNLTTNTPIPVSECCASETTKASSTPQSSSSTQTSTTSSSIATALNTTTIGAPVTPDISTSVSSSQLVQTPSTSSTRNGSFVEESIGSTRTTDEFTNFVVQQFSVRTTRPPVPITIGTDCVNYTDSRQPRPANICENYTSEATKSVSPRNSNGSSLVTTTSSTSTSNSLSTLSSTTTTTTTASTTTSTEVQFSSSSSTTTPTSSFESTSSTTTTNLNSELTSTPFFLTSETSKFLNMELSSTTTTTTTTTNNFENNTTSSTSSTSTTLPDTEAVTSTTTNSNENLTTTTAISVGNTTSIIATGQSSETSTSGVITVSSVSPVENTTTIQNVSEPTIASSTATDITSNSSLQTTSANNTMEMSSNFTTTTPLISTSLVENATVVPTDLTNSTSQTQTSSSVSDSSSSSSLSSSSAFSTESLSTTTTFAGETTTTTTALNSTDNATLLTTVPSFLNETGLPTNSTDSTASTTTTTTTTSIGTDMLSSILSNSTDTYTSTSTTTTVETLASATVIVTDTTSPTVLLSTESSTSTSTTFDSSPLISLNTTASIFSTSPLSETSTTTASESSSYTTTTTEAIVSGISGDSSTTTPPISTQPVDSTTTTLVNTELVSTTTTADPGLVEIVATLASIQVPPMNMSNWTTSSSSDSSGQTNLLTTVISPVSPASSPDGNGQSTARLFFDRPPSDNFLLSVGLKVPPSQQTNNQDFTTSVRRGLMRGYVEGRRKQLGTFANNEFVRYSTNENIRLPRMDRSTTPSDFRFKRALNDENNGTFNGDVNIELTSVDRISQEDVKVRFFVLSNGRYVEGSKAKETFAQVSDYELSALITHPVTEPVTTLMEEKTVVPRSSVPLYIIIILVVLGILLLFFIVFGIICYKKQRKTFTKVKETNSDFSERNSPAPIITPDKSRVSSVASRYPIVKGDLISGDQTDRSRARSDSRSFPPVDRKKKLISEMTEAELIDDDTYEELFSYVKPPPQPKKIGLTRIHHRDEVVLSPTVNVPIYFPPQSGGFEGSQIVRISPTQRRRQAREILDATFPSPSPEIRRILNSYSEVI